MQLQVGGSDYMCAIHALLPIHSPTLARPPHPACGSLAHSPLMSSEAYLAMGWPTALATNGTVLRARAGGGEVTFTTSLRKW